MSQLQKIFKTLADVGWSSSGRDCLAYSRNEDLAHAKAKKRLKTDLCGQLGCLSLFFFFELDGPGLELLNDFSFIHVSKQ